MVDDCCNFQGVIDIPQKKSIEDKQKKTKMIVDAAEKVFFSQGYKKASMDDVAKEADVAKGTLYLYFKSKMDLYYAIGFRALRTMVNMFEEAASKCSSGREKVIEIGRAFARYYIEYPDYYSFIVAYQTESVLLSKSNPGITETVKESRKLFELVVNSVKEGMDDGSISIKMDPVKLSAVLWCQTSGVIQLAGLKENFFQMFSSLTSDEIIQAHIEQTERKLK